MIKSEFWITAGGTGGHIIPGLEIGKEIEASMSDATIVYFSGRRAIEKKVYADAGINPRELRSGLNYQGILGILRFFDATHDFLRVFFSMLRNRPRAVLATGGAVCFPVLAVARILRVPIFLHESNAIPGRLVRLFSKAATRVFLGIPAVIDGRSQLVGTPARSAAGVDKNERDIVVCVGGSQGAAVLNRCFVSAVASLADEFPRIHFVLITGPGKSVEGTSRLTVMEYCSALPELLGKSILAISRAGSGSLADLANQRVPSILIPYPHAMDDHQTVNATVYTEAGAARMLEESRLTEVSLAEEMATLLRDSESRGAMKAALAAFDSKDAASRIVTSMMNDLGIIPSVSGRNRLETSHA